MPKFLFWSFSSYLGKLIFHVKGPLLWASPLPCNHLREGLCLLMTRYIGVNWKPHLKKKMQHSLYLPDRFCSIRMKNNGENKDHSVEHDPFWAISNQFMDTPLPSSVCICAALNTVLRIFWQGCHFNLNVSRWLGGKKFSFAFNSKIKMIWEREKHFPRRSTFDAI